MPRAANLVLLVVATACSTRSTGGAERESSEVEAMVAQACERGSCSDEMASVTVWRDAQGQVKLLVHEGSLKRCSHPPTSYITPDGEVRLVQANQPVEGAEDAARFEAERKQVLDGLTADRPPMRCPQPGR